MLGTNTFVWRAVFCAIAFSAGSAFANPPSTPVGPWFADRDRVYQIDAVTHNVVTAIPLPERPSALAIDPNNGDVWVAVHKHLLKFDASTSLVLDIHLREAANLIALNPFNRTVWLAAGKELLQIGSDGLVATTSKLTENIHSIALGIDGRVWILTESYLSEIDAAGNVRTRKPLTDLNIEHGHDVLADPIGGFLWIATGNDVVQLSSDNLGRTGVAVVAPAVSETYTDDSDKNDTREDAKDEDDVDAPAIQRVALDALTGTIWLTTKQTILAFDRGALLLHQLALPPKARKARVFLFDPMSRGVWIGGHELVYHFSPGAVLLGEVAVGKKIEVGGNAPLLLTPDLSLIQPIDALTNQPKPAFDFLLGARCYEQACDAGEPYYLGFTIDAQINGAPVGTQFSIVGGHARYLPIDRLLEGVNRFTAQAVDRFGHRSRTVSGQFTIDTIPPVVTIDSPAPDAITNQPKQQLRGHLSEPGALAIDGLNVPLDDRQSFIYPLTLVEGSNVYQLVAQDYATNVSRTSFRLVLDTVPPKFTRLQPDTGKVFSVPDITVEGSTDDPSAMVDIPELATLNGVVVSANPSQFSFKLKLKTGNNDVTVVARDVAGNSTIVTLKLIYRASAVKIDTPSLGTTIKTAAMTFTGTFEGDLNTGITVNGIPADTYDGRFVANNVPLAIGENTLTVVANDLEGESGRETLTVTRVDAPAIGVDRVTPMLAHLSVVAGNGMYGFGGDGGPATAASLAFPGGLAFGSDGSLYIADSDNNRIRRVANGIIATFAGTGIAGSNGDGGPAAAAQLNVPSAIAVGADGSVYIADYFNMRVRRVDSNGIVTTIAGTGDYGSGGDGGPAVQATLAYPSGIALGADGSVYIAEEEGHRIRRVDPSGIITTIAGTGNAGSAGNNGPAIQAELLSPTDIAIDATGAIYVAEPYASRVRRIDPNGVIASFAGTGSYGDSGDGGPAQAALLSSPYRLALSADRTVYIVDTDAGRVRRVNPQGVIATVVGGGSAASAQLVNPLGIAVSPEGVLTISDTDRHQIRAVTTLNTADGAPLLVAFKLNNQTGKGFQRLDVDYDGDGTIDFSTGDPNAALQHYYTAVGVYTAHFTLTDTQQNIYRTAYTLVIEAIDTKDRRLRSVYAYLIDQLKAGNADRALNAFSAGAHDKYQQAFADLTVDLPTVANQLGTLHTSMLAENFAEYVITREEAGATKAFLIYLIRGEDGVWRLDNM